jgi:Uma2 family endonuclease
MVTVAISDTDPWVAPPPLAVHRFTVEQYHRMIETGVLTEDDRVELLEGWIVDKMPQHPGHAGAISVLEARLRDLLPKAWVVRAQSPITLEDSEPEPDLAVVKGPVERYLTAHPGPEDIALVIDVADTSIEKDRTVKGRAYAQARIPVYWVVDLQQIAIEIYSQPKGGKTPQYRAREVVGVQLGAPVLVGGRTLGAVPVADLFPK